MAAQFSKVAALEAPATGCKAVAELLPALARFNALPLAGGDADTLDAHLTRLIRCESIWRICSCHRQGGY